MGRLSVEMIKDNIVVTRFESAGYVIPDNISQKKQVVAIINSNLDSEDVSETSIPVDKLAVPRKEFITKLLSISSECQERYSVYGKGLYSLKDMEKGITWAEVAYLLYYVGGLDRVLDWNAITPRENDRVCVLYEVVSEVNRKLDVKLASYKNRLDMENYIKSIISGGRYIPLPMYCSFVDLCDNGDVIEEIELDIDMMFKKISVAEFNKLFSGGY